MVSSSPCFKKSHKPKISLNYIPEDLLVEISLCVGTSSLSEIHNLQLVSKSFQRFCNERYVLHRLSLHEIERFLWIHHRCENFSNFFNRCVENENHEALYHRGIVDYFHQVSEEQRDKGLKYLAKAAKKGNRKAQYVYGLILVCLGGITKHKGFKILCSLIKTSSMSDMMEEMEELRNNIRDNIMWRGIPVVRQLKANYVRENCSCDGRTEEFLKKSAWHRHGESNDMNTSSACEICLWHQEVQLCFEI